MGKIKVLFNKILCHYFGHKEYETHYGVKEVMRGGKKKKKTWTYFYWATCSRCGEKMTKDINLGQTWRREDWTPILECGQEIRKKYVGR